MHEGLTNCSINDSQVLPVIPFARISVKFLRCNLRQRFVFTVNINNGPINSFFGLHARYVIVEADLDICLNTFFIKEPSLRANPPGGV